MEIHISVRNLVEFILRSGNIDNRRTTAPENAMQEGGRIHRLIQRTMGADYHAEVFLRHIEKTPDYDIHIEGRADGIIISQGGDIAYPPPLPGSEGDGDSGDLVSVTIDEIKGTYRDIHKMKEAVPVHLAQAKCYAYIYGIQNGLRHIRVRLTYCNIDTEEIRYFYFEFDKEELDNWFGELMGQYRKWADFQFSWQKERQASMKNLSFPFPYRKGQKELVSYVYRTIYHKRKLFIEAPTGVGKTISALFPAVKAFGEGMGEKIFYLTAKTITRTVADDTIELMRKKGLKFKSVVLTAKDKICFMEETECNPEFCPYAKGHFDRINDAIYDLLTHADNFNREAVEDCARAHKVCPFELCLDMSLFADGVIGDYNYLFDPHVYLRRFFAEGVREDYIFLIDEAHNLVDRGREMYSAVLKKEDFLALKKVVKEYEVKLYRQLEACNRELLKLKRQCEDYTYLDDEDMAPFIRALTRLSAAMEDYLEDNEEGAARGEVLDFYFEVSHFLLINDKLDENYVVYTQLASDGGFSIRLFCVNPAKNLRECMTRGRSTILFSATLLPIQYYKRLLGGEAEDYEVYAHSVFDPEKKRVFVAEDVTSRYTRRSDMEYYNIAAYIHNVISQREGNYMVFFPSHVFLKSIYDVYYNYFLDTNRVECLLQEERMDEKSREEFLARFAGADEEGKTLLGFCVLGGIFSEGIDLKKDSLIGAIIVGTGLPQVCNEREILKSYFDLRGESGFDFAYKYPGMNKVLQAAGRVIRTVDDVGIIVLLDERFLNSSYLRMFPREWEKYERISLEQIGRRIERFWNEWL
ncbi:ATP-dependent DNA helicase [Parablautia muri]|uniref:ATP-dependent DNA helicase n=1 Tax=Parablautia muri TaxID=2320879 RepID=A0A9X5BF62_9FIRM|nr:ATP-dependent DNA helicase [Parablautia muri]NBJ92914.1 ATP-dependent DNA helicase [Parablautia muri]